MTTFRRALCLGLWLLVSPGCDPGFNYVIPGAPANQRNGLLFVVRVADGVEARFNAGIFTSSGSVHVQVVNQSDDPIQFRFAPAEITFGGGKPVHEKRCVEDFPAEPITIHRGEMITVSCRFVVNEIGPGGYSSDYRYLHIALPGVSRNGAPLKVAATMEWKN